MMRMFRTLGMALAVACGALMNVVGVVLEPLVRFVAIGCEALACGIDKLKRELVQHGLLGSGAEECTEGGLRRESNGYRQESAKCTGIQVPMAC